MLQLRFFEVFFHFVSHFATEKKELWQIWCQKTKKRLIKHSLKVPCINKSLVILSAFQAVL